MSGLFVPLAVVGLVAVIAGVEALRDRLERRRHPIPTAVWPGAPADGAANRLMCDFIHRHAAERVRGTHRRGARHAPPASEARSEEGAC